MPVIECPTCGLLFQLTPAVNGYNVNAAPNQDLRICQQRTPPANCDRWLPEVKRLMERELCRL